MSEFVLYPEHIRGKTKRAKLYSFVVDPVGHKTTSFLQKCLRPDIEAVLHDCARSLSQGIFKTHKSISIDLFRTNGKTQLQMYKWEDSSSQSLMFFNKNERVRILIAEIFAVKVSPKDSMPKWHTFAHKMRIARMREYVKVYTAAVPKCVYDLLALEYNKLATGYAAMDQDGQKNSPDSIMCSGAFDTHPPMVSLRRAEDIYKFAAKVSTGSGNVDSVVFDSQTMLSAMRVVEWME